MGKSSVKGRRVSGSKLGAAALAAALAGPAGEAQAIVGGQLGGPGEASAVMVLHDRGGICTGIVLADVVVLTAAHCVPPGAAARVHFRERGQPALEAPISVLRHPGYRANAVQERTRSIDMALIRLANPLPPRFRPATLSGQEAPAGARLSVGGFGLSREGDASTAGTWRSASIEASEPFGPSRILLWARAGAGIGACQGDSGGPILNAGGDVVAVTSWTTGEGSARCGQLTQGALLGPQRAWIDGALLGWGRQASWR
jgi:hypothetical protein